MYTINFSTEISFYIHSTAFYIALYPELDQTEPPQVWHDTLAPTQGPNGPASVSTSVAA